MGRVPIVVDWSKSFWTCPNYKISPEKSNFNLTKMIWTRPKQFGPDQNNLYPCKTIWTVQNHFGPIEGQGIHVTNISAEISILTLSNF